MSEEGNSNLDGSTENNENLWINNEGTFGDMETAPEGMRDFIAKKGFKDVGAITNAYGELESKMGGMEGMVRIPGSDDAEGWTSFAQAHLGTPADVDGYSFDKTDGDPEIDETLISGFKAYALSKNMSQAAFNDTVRFQLDAAKAQVKINEDAYTAQVVDSQKAIRERFNTDAEYEDYTKKGLGFAESFKLDENRSLADVFEEKGLMQDSEILDVLGSLADRVAEDSLPARGGTRTPPNREVQLKAIQEDPAFTDASHPKHYEVLAKFHALYANKG